MGFWPFGGGKRQRVVETEEPGRETLLRRTPSDTMAPSEKYSRAPTLGPTGSENDKGDNQTRRLSKTQTPSSKALNYTQPARSQTTPVRPIEDARRISQTNSQYNEKSLYQQNPTSQSSLGPENFTVVRPPTLHAKRSEHDSHLPRRKSGKRKAEDYAREREIRAMSSSPIPIPKRPSTLYDSGPLQRDSRQIPGPLNRRLERPTSEISLPLPGSLPDILSFQNQNSFKVGVLAALSPRPTVRYDANPKITAGKQPMRPNMAIQQAIAEDDTSDKKRIDELADDLDAGGLRELMERDRRRRERKKDLEKARLQRRLQRRAERQREDEARRARTEAFVRSTPTDSPRVQASGLDRPLTPKDSPPRRLQPSSPGEDPFSDLGPSTNIPRTPIRNPFEDEKDMDVMQDPQDVDDERDASGSSPIPIPVHSPLRRVEMGEKIPREQPSQSTLSPPTSPVHCAVDRSSLSQGSLLNREAIPEILQESSSIERRASDQGSQRLGSWTTFFRRGTRRKFTGPSQGRTTPSEFSNTSRESFSRKQPPVAPAARTFRRSDSATPQRTLSRFREDLPELPISPPDSRLQSPETTVPQVRDVTSASTDLPRTTPVLAASTRDSAGLQMAEQLNRPLPKNSLEYDPASASTGMILSQSMASVDSEGSWLSGKPSKRFSGQISHALKPSQSSLTRHMPGAFDQEVEDDLMSDDYYKRVSTGPQPQQPQDEPVVTTRKASSALLDFKQEQESVEEVLNGPEVPNSLGTDDEKWRQRTIAQPAVVRQPEQRKSKEGLLDEFTRDQEDSDSSSDEAGDDQDSDTPEAETKESTIMRAKSVEYKAHGRHISGGSAKLLNISRGSIHSDRSRPTTMLQSSDPTQRTETPPPSIPEPKI